MLKQSLNQQVRQLDIELTNRETSMEFEARQEADLEENIRKLNSYE